MEFNVRIKPVSGNPFIRDNDSSIILTNFQLSNTSLWLTVWLWFKAKMTRKSRSKTWLSERISAYPFLPGKSLATSLLHQERHRENLIQNPGVQFWYFISFYRFPTLWDWANVSEKKKITKERVHAYNKRYLSWKGDLVINNRVESVLVPELALGALLVTRVHKDTAIQ